jgi:DNA-binding winged helix-turn-helix (wHTH) protein
MAFSQSDLKIKTDNSLNSYVFVDKINDIEEFKYLAFIRRYDKIYIDINNHSIKDFDSFFKSVNDIEDFKVNIVFISNDEIKLTEANSFIKNKFKHIKSEYIFIEQKWINKYISENIEHSFFETPETIKDLKIDIKNQVIHINLGEEVMSIDMAEKMNKKAFQLFLFFVRHYGEVLTISTILSATSKEPELASYSPIEGAISNIRTIFEDMVNLNNVVKSVKKVGYVLNLSNDNVKLA